MLTNLFFFLLCAAFNRCPGQECYALHVNNSLVSLTWSWLLKMESFLIMSSIAWHQVGGCCTKKWQSRLANRGKKNYNQCHVFHATRWIEVRAWRSWNATHYLLLWTFPFPSWWFPLQHTNALTLSMKFNCHSLKPNAFQC